MEAQPPSKKMIDRLIKILAGIFLIVFAALGISSAMFESAIVDEVPHITAGYSYLIEKDMRLNPEHPPLLKDISAVFLLPLNLNFPFDSKSWIEDINGQWNLGNKFFYESGNDPDKILFWARLGPLLLTVIFGIFIFKFAKNFFSPRIALLTLFLFLFSPTILAHSRYVTTDIAAGFGFFTAIFYFLKFLKEPNGKNLLIAGVFFGIAQLFKFSLILLIPFFIFILIFWILVKNTHEKFTKPFYIFSTFLILIIGYLFIVFPVYQFHILNYPAAPQNIEQKNIILSVESCDEIDKSVILASQFRDTACQLKKHEGSPLLKDYVIWASDKPVLRAFSQYALGVMMSSSRFSEKGLNYFFGKVSYGSHKAYFPASYLIKEPFPLHILSLIAVFILLQSARSFRIKEHFTEIVLLVFVVLYLSISISANLNIGIRHIIPIYPFIFLLISATIMRRLEALPKFDFTPDLSIIKKIFIFYFHKFLKYIAVFFLLLWYLSSSVSVFPNFLTYFNEFAGGHENGYKYLSDSNLDWGQSLKQLSIFTEKNNIREIHLDYFGNGFPEYYLKAKYIPWSSERGAPKGWFAVSAHYLGIAEGEPSGSFEREEKDSYIWLKDKIPTAKIGNSIFIYYFE